MRSLRRVFLPADYAGGDTKYWEAQWLEELRRAGKIHKVSATNFDTDHMLAMRAQAVNQFCEIAIS